MLKERQTALEDVSRGQSSLGGRLSQVGMSNVEWPLTVHVQGELWRLMASGAVSVSLDDEQAKGIHMSRLYSLTTQFFEASEFRHPFLLKNLLEEIRDSQEGLSRTARLELSFDFPLKRPALKSAGGGWRSYPVTLKASLGASGFELLLGLEVVYASTCPCSAALARQLIQSKFEDDFSGQASVSAEQVKKWLGLESSIAGVPHAQRSFARLELEYENLDQWPVESLVSEIEATLKTPVQTFVKREDEQEFARLNALDLKFCEDAARSLKQLFASKPELKDFSGSVEHVESLHAHSAIASFCKDF